MPRKKEKKGGVPFHFYFGRIANIIYGHTFYFSKQKKREKKKMMI